jgi:rhodanese-related sulfurtransferase
MVKTISREEFKQRLDSGEYILIDVRTEAENLLANIPESLILDISQPDFAQKILSLDKDKKYLIYCASGNRSSYALSFMEQSGFKEVYELEGGIMNW